MAHTLQQQMPLVSSRAGVFLLDFSHYLNTDALPYVAAIVLALWLHADLRSQVFFRRPAEPPQPEDRQPGRAQGVESKGRKDKGKRRGYIKSPRP